MTSNGSGSSLRIDGAVSARTSGQDATRPSSSSVAKALIAACLAPVRISPTDDGTPEMIQKRLVSAATSLIAHLDRGGHS